LIDVSHTREKMVRRLCHTHTHTHTHTHAYREREREGERERERERERQRDAYEVCGTPVGTHSLG
jgi:hypothetical protein